MSRISLNIVLFIILGVVLSASVIGVLSISQASRILEDESYEKLRFISLSYANEFSLYLGSTEGIVDTLVSKIISEFELESFREDHEYREQYMTNAGVMLQDIARKNDFMQGIYLVINPGLTGAVYESWYISDGKGDYIYQEPEALSTFYPENEDMSWYYDPVRQKRGVWSHPYMDATIDVKMISYTDAVYDDGELLAVVGIDLSFSKVQDTIEGMMLYRSGYGVLLDENYRVIIHPVLPEGTDIREVDGGSQAPVVAVMEHQDSYAFDYVYEGENKILGFSKLINDWIFITAVSASDLRQPVDKLRVNIAIIVLITIFISITIGLKISGSIMNQLNTLQELTEHIGNGNFDVSVDIDTKDEFAKLRSSFGIMSRKIAESHKELKDANRHMEIMAFHDPLTHLPNRRSGMNRLGEILENYQENCRLCGIMAIDLDRFKEVNDTMGHDAGDQLLLHISEKMSHQIDNKDMLCRMGGDEFLLIFNSVPSLDLVKAMADRLLLSGSSPITINAQEVSISCSIGIAMIERKGIDIKEIMKKADEALYSVKKEGRNGYIFYSEKL